MSVTSLSPSRPRPRHVTSLSPKKVIETENFAKKSCQTHFKGDKNTSIVMLPPPLPLLLPPKPLHFWARRSRATYIQHNLEFHHLSRVGPKQLCAPAHLGSTREAGTFQSNIHSCFYPTFLFFIYFRIELLNPMSYNTNHTNMKRSWSKNVYVSSK